MTLRVIVAEDSLLVREGVVALLRVVDGVEVVATCGDLPSLLAQVEASPPDVVLTDIRMPPTGTDEGIQAASALRTSHPDIGVVVLSQHSDPGYALALFEGGSARRAYLLKERLSEPEQLLAAIREVARGGSVVDPQVVEVLVSARRRGSASPLALLTVREAEVLAAIAEGRNNQGVASTLGLSERAVAKHINSLFAKLGLGEEVEVHRRVMAVLLYLADRGRV